MQSLFYWVLSPKITFYKNSRALSKFWGKIYFHFGNSFDNYIFIEYKLKETDSKSFFRDKIIEHKLIMIQYTLSKRETSSISLSCTKPRVYSSKIFENAQFFSKILTKNRQKNRQKTDKKPTPYRFLKFSVSVFVGRKKTDKTDKICRFSDTRPTKILSVAILDQNAKTPDIRFDRELEVQCRFWRRPFDREFNICRIGVVNIFI